MEIGDDLVFKEIAKFDSELAALKDGKLNAVKDRFGQPIADIPPSKELELIQDYTEQDQSIMDQSSEMLLGNTPLNIMGKNRPLTSKPSAQALYSKIHPTTEMAKS